mmetsp:Transcript_52804/g.113067  ORF Transcript_52804/g.113067 Transcript_52804/m.113067 type:complete len:423 (-) Transcript_52804:999-2267(-)
MSQHLGAESLRCAMHLRLMDTCSTWIASRHITTAQEAPPLRVFLKQRGIALERLESLLEAVDLLSATPRPLLIGLRFCHALLLELGKVLLDGSELLPNAIPVRGKLGRSLAEGLGLFALVLQILLLGSPGDLRFLDLCVVGCSGGLFLGCLLGKAFGEVRLHHLEKANDALTCTFSLGIVFVRATVILAEDFQSHLAALDSFLQLRLVLKEECLFLLADLRHIPLLPCHVRQLLLDRRHLGRQLCRLGSHLVDLAGQFLKLSLLVILLAFCLSHLLVAVSLLGRLRVSLLLKPAQHVRDEAFHLGEGVLTREGGAAHSGVEARRELCQGRRIGPPCQPLQPTHHPDVCGHSGTHALPDLQEGHLAQAVTLLLGPASLFRDHLLRRCDRLQLLISGFGLLLKVCCLAHAIAVQFPKVLHVARQ